MVLLGAVSSRSSCATPSCRPHETSFGQEASQVVRNVVAGLKEVARRAPAALGLSSFQMLRYQFWGFGLFVSASTRRTSWPAGDSDTLSLVLSGVRRA